MITQVAKMDRLRFIFQPQLKWDLLTWCKFIVLTTLYCQSERLKKLYPKYKIA